MSKKEEKYIDNLLSGDQELINSTVEQIKEEGNIALVPFLIDLLNTSSDEAVTKIVYGVLCELKQTASIPLLIGAISDEKYSSIQDTLIRICWENGLDYSPYLSTFVDIVINGSFMNAFEAFTVIENLEVLPPTEETKALVERLETSFTKATDDKKNLLEDLIKILR